MTFQCVCVCLCDYISVQVVFPPNNFLRSENDFETLKKLLPEQDDVIIPDDCEEVSISSISIGVTVQFSQFFNLLFKQKIIDYLN